MTASRGASLPNMPIPKGLTPPQEFFFEWAGWSYTPEKETPEDGRKRGAIELAAAEAKAHAAGCSWQWSIDPYTDSSEFSNNRRPWSLWQCCMRNAAGEIVASLHGIDFGRDGEPWGDPYRRVVEAELAEEWEAQ